MSRKNADARAWMPLYIGDYLRDTRHLSTTEHGAYLLLLMEYWQRRGPLPNNDVILARLSAMAPDEWQAARENIAGFFHITDAKWRHHRVDEEIEKAEKMAKNAQKNGKKGGRPPSKNTQEKQSHKPTQNPDHNPQHNPDHNPQKTPSPSPSPIESSSDEEDSPPNPPRGSEMDLLGDAPPNPNQIARDAFAAFQSMARQYGLPVPEALSEDRKKIIKARLKDHGPQAIQRLLDAYNQSAFLRGERGNATWKGAVFDWAFRPTNFQKIIEGNYVDPDQNSRRAADGQTGSGGGAGDIFEDFGRRD